jgi:hypothetical protein
LKALVSAKISIFFLKIRVKSSFPPIQLLEGEAVGCLTLRSYFYPTFLTFGDAKSDKNPKCSFLLQNQQWNQRMNSHEPCI